MNPSLVEVADDSGFLGIIDPDSYECFVDEGWSMEDLISHFKAQMKERCLLIWGTGAADIWRIKVGSESGPIQGFREVVGDIKSSRGRLCLTNYESLTMAAQFREVRLPEKHHLGLILKVPAGQYRCRIVQRTNPEDESVGNSDWDFLLELQQGCDSTAAWNSIPWSDLESGSV